MKILIACEFSGIVRDALIAKGHDAISCDLLPSESPGPHIQGDVLPILKEKWDLVIAHPPCTYLANSGVRWLYEELGRWTKLGLATDFFIECLKANSPKIAIENPIMHKHAKIAIGIDKPDCIIQPWQYGHPETKAICLWLKNLPPLKPTNIVEGREQRIHKMSPSSERSKNRSRFYPGVAKAMADQWS